jgi:hypothetical protein
MKSKVIKTSFSVEPELLETSKLVARMLGYRFSYSAYVSDLIRKDVECRTNKTINTRNNL